MSSRIAVINETKHVGTCVVYVMSRDQRVQDNHALYFAQQTALAHKLPLLVCFNLFPSLKMHAREQFEFMIRGLSEVGAELSSLNIPFVTTVSSDGSTLIETLRELNPQSIYFDFSPLNGARAFAKRVSKELTASTYVVDTHNIIPAWIASDKQEFAAHTFRHKVHRHLEKYLVEPGVVIRQTINLEKMPSSVPIASLLDHVTAPRRNIDFEAKPGTTAALQTLHSFIENKLANYAASRNDIAIDGQSELSPYLHFGSLSSLRVALEVLNATKTYPLLFQKAKMAQAGDIPNQEDGMNALFEEMIVRKELSDNFCLFAPTYDSLSAAPQWAQTTLNEHRDDVREYTYTKDQLETANTHDEAWNAAQRQLLHSGKIHGYMRMYWAKKILEWTNSPEEAFEVALYLNDAYSVDGGDPNGYVGVLWSVAGLHDRPWTERAVFGKIRYMNYAGLQRKFNLD